MRDKKGQATVEFILMIAVLVPIVVAGVAYLNNNVIKKLETVLQSEVTAQVRYGYSKQFLGSSFNDADAAKTSGEAPLPYGPQGSQTKHPIGHIKEGWN